MENVSFDMVLIRLLCRNLRKLRKKYVSRFNPQELVPPPWGRKGWEGGGREGESEVAGMKASHGFRFNKTYQGYYVFFLAETSYNITKCLEVHWIVFIGSEILDFFIFSQT